MVHDDHGEDHAGPHDGPAVEERSDPPMRRLGHHHRVQRGRAATPVGRADPVVGAPDGDGRLHRRRRRERLAAAVGPPAGPTGAEGSSRRGRAVDGSVQWDEVRPLLNRLWAAFVDRLVAWLRRRVSRVIDARPGGPFPEAAEPGDNLPTMDAPDATSRGLRAAAAPPSPVPGGADPRPGATPVWRVTVARPEAHAPVHVVEADEQAGAGAREAVGAHGAEPWDGTPGGVEPQMAGAADAAPEPGAAGQAQPAGDAGGGPEQTTAEHLELLVQAEGVLDRVDRALARLDDGSYGTCEICSGPIADEDLESDPTASRCARHLPLAEGA